MKRYKKNNRGGVAKTPFDYKMGILAGKDTFKFNNSGPHKMTMNPAGMQIPFPIAFEGYDTDGDLIDHGMAMPNTDFYVNGVTVKEYPMVDQMQEGGLVPEPMIPRKQTGIFTGAGKKDYYNQQRTFKPESLEKKYDYDNLMPRMSQEERESIDWQTQVKTGPEVYNEKARNYKNANNPLQMPEATGRELVEDPENSEWGIPAYKTQDPQDIYRATDAQYNRVQEPDINDVVTKRLLDEFLPKEEETVEEKKTEAPKQNMGSDERNLWSEFAGKEGKMKMQRMLKDLGFYEGELDGILARQSGDAVEKFQKSYGLASDRIAGVNTLNKLKEIHNRYQEVYQDEVSKRQLGGFAGGIPGLDKYIKDDLIYNPDLGLPDSSHIPQQPLMENVLLPDPDMWSGNRPDPITILTDPNKDGKSPRVPSNSSDNLYNPNSLKWYDAPISAMYNTIRGFEKPEKYPVRYNEFAPQVLSGLNSMKFTPDFNPVRLASNAAMSTIRNTSTNVGGMLANMSNVTANTQKLMGNLIRAADQQNNQYKGMYLNALANEGLHRIAARTQARDLNDKAKANRNEFRGAAAAQWDQWTSGVRNLSNQTATNNMKQMAINAQHPSYQVQMTPEGDYVQYYINPETGDKVEVMRTNANYKPLAKKPKYKTKIRK